MVSFSREAAEVPAKNSAAAWFPSKGGDVRFWAVRYVGKDIADASLGMNQFLRIVPVDLNSQGADIHVDYVGEPFEGRVPNMLENHGSGHRTVHIPQQVFQQEELFRA
jgi:hypothetical protein